MAKLPITGGSNTVIASPCRHGMKSGQLTPHYHGQMFRATIRTDSGK